MDYGKKKTTFTLICKWISFLTLLFCLILGIDLIMPRKHSIEVVLSKDKELLKGASHQYDVRNYRESRESRLIVTENYKFPVKIGHMLNYRPGDTIEVDATRILKIVTHGTVQKGEGPVYSLNPAISILDVFWFIPVVTFLTAMAGTILALKKIKIIDFGIVNLMLLWILLQMMRIIPF